MTAPYTGGFSPGADIFAVEGNFGIADPCGPPRISYPMRGDSVFSDRDIVIFDGSNFIEKPLGTFPNIQPWSANQAQIVIEQDFMVAQSYYQPMRLNTPYNIAWAIGWLGAFPGGGAIPALQSCILVAEGPLEQVDIGISRFTRMWASIPFTRNAMEQHVYNVIGYGADSSDRPRKQIAMLSRVQYDYFVFDDFNILPLGVFPAGPKLDVSTGLYPTGMILQEQKYYGEDTETEVDSLDNALPTNPTLSHYLAWVGDVEIIAESSCIERYMGNIWERRTRFVLAQ